MHGPGASRGERLCALPPLPAPQVSKLLTGSRNWDRVGPADSWIDVDVNGRTLERTLNRLTCS
jgi:hypothetical protein